MDGGVKAPTWLEDCGDGARSLGRWPTGRRCMKHDYSGRKLQSVQLHAEYANAAWTEHGWQQWPSVTAINVSNKWLLVQTRRIFMSVSDRECSLSYIYVYMKD